MCQFITRNNAENIKTFQLSQNEFPFVIFLFRSLFYIFRKRLTLIDTYKALNNFISLIIIFLYFTSFSNNYIYTFRITFINVFCLWLQQVERFHVPGILLAENFPRLSKSSTLEMINDFLVKIIWISSNWCQSEWQLYYLFLFHGNDLKYKQILQNMESTFLENALLDSVCVASEVYKFILLIKCMKMDITNYI